jgi:hypothetical protein
MLVVLSPIASAQGKGTESTAEAVVQLLNYCTTHIYITIRYHTSDMVLHTISDASYLSEAGACSRTDGHLYLGHKEGQEQLINGPLLVLSDIMKHVMSSASEVEVGFIFTNVKEAAPIRVTLDEMGHPQPATPIQTGNSTADGIINGEVNQNWSKVMDMRF